MRDVRLLSVDPASIVLQDATASMSPSAPTPAEPTRHALVSSGSLHEVAYLLRLLDEHRPSDPLTFLTAVQRRGGGGMSLEAPLLLEVLRQAEKMPMHAVLETLRFSCSDGTGIGDQRRRKPGATVSSSDGSSRTNCSVPDAWLRDALWRDVTLAAADAMSTIAARCPLPEMVPAVVGGDADDSANDASDRSRRAPSFGDDSAVLGLASELPHFGELYEQGAPWQMLMAHQVVTSRWMLRQLAREMRVKHACPLLIHTVVEVDAESADIMSLFTPRDASSDGGDLLALLVEEIGSWAPPSPSTSNSASDDGSSSSLVCTLEVVLVSTTQALQNPQSRTHAVLRVVEEQLRLSYGPSGSAKRPTFLANIRVHLADRSQWAFAPLQVLFSESSSGNGNTTKSVLDVRSNGFVIWIRDARAHAELLLQAGHMLHRFATETTKSLAASNGLPAGAGALLPAIGVLDSGSTLLLDASKTAEVLLQRPDVLGPTAATSVLRRHRVTPGELFYGHVQRDLLWLSCGPMGPLQPASTEVVLLRLGSASAVQLLPSAATMRRSLNGNTTLSEQPSLCESLMRLVACLATTLQMNQTASALQPLPGSPQPSLPAELPRERAHIVVTVPSRVLRCSRPAAPSSADMVAALQSGSLIRQALVSLGTDATDAAAISSSATDGGDADGGLSVALAGDFGAPPACASPAGTWVDALSRLSAASWDKLIAGPPRSEALVHVATVLGQRHGIEACMRRSMPVPGMLSVSMCVAEDAPPGGSDASSSAQGATASQMYPVHLTPSYISDAVAGTRRTPRHIAEGVIAMRNALAAQHAATMAAPPPASPTNDANNGKKKKAS